MDDPEPIQLPTRVEMTRREALQALAAGIALVQAGCLEAPGDELRPYVDRPIDGPGPALYATSMVLDGFATGLLVESQEGRPIKIDGNPAHPASLGGTTAIHQASIFDLYDPHRLRLALEAGLPATWRRLAEALLAPPAGELWLVLPPQSSPLVGELLARIRERHRGARVVFHAAAGHAAAYRGSAQVLEAPLEVQLDLAGCDVVVALDADLLVDPRCAREFARRRRIASPADQPNRLYVAEPMVTPTGSLADHRLAARAGDLAAVAVGILRALRDRGAVATALPGAIEALATRRLDAIGAQRWIAAVADDLRARPGASAVAVGDRQGAACHALGLLINAATGALGRTVTTTEPALLEPLGDASLAELAAAIRAGQVGTVVALECNPVYDAPHALDLAAALATVPLTVHATLRAEETSRVCRWTAPVSHYLEAWGDARASDGTISFIQPLIRPMYGTPSTIEVLAMLGGERSWRGRAMLADRWRGVLAGDAAWSAALGAGFLPGTAAPPRPAVPMITAGLLAELEALLAPRPEDRLEVALATSPSLHDGRFAGNAWLQELPQPVTKLTWGNAALLGPGTAARLGVTDGALLRLAVDGRQVDAPALVVPGHAEQAITLDLGYGRRAPALPIADRLGSDGFVLLDDAGGLIRGDVMATVAGGRRRLARTQGSFDDHERGIAPVADLATYRRDPGFTGGVDAAPPSFFAQGEWTVLQWAMTIDTTICTGCSSCVIACQAENNVPVVGAAEVARGREMHWLRIDTYRDGDELVHQPMLCQHCELAPCEYVCPVNATVHSPDGLNEMVYNRCIGTRFCSNNCPYKVRRFNWFDYHDEPATTASLQHNPDVTVRSRGVMEKCTYCVQRIRGAEIAARVEDRAIRPGEVVTACQQACPTQAIQFGALQHRDQPMARWRREPRSYAVLGHLGTRPRTVYLAKIRNPKPGFGDGGGA